MITAIFALVIFLLLFGMPVAFALGLTGILGVMATAGKDAAFGFLQTVPYRGTASFELTVIPMFLLMGELAASSGMTKDIFNAISRWIGQLPGGLAVSTIVASAFIAAISGSSTASAGMLAKVAVEEMQRFGYARKMALGVVTVAGTLAIMIPPSIALVLYGILSQNSIGELLVAGIVPGIMVSIVLCLVTIVWAMRAPHLAPRAPSATWGERFRSLSGIWPLALLVVLVLGSIYSGAATPSEAASVGAVGTFAISMWYMRGISPQMLKRALLRTAHTSSMIFLIIIGANLFGYFLTISQTTHRLVEGLAGLHIAPLAVIGLLVLMYLVLGFFMEQIAILTLTIPIVVPVVVGLGFNPIWFGVVQTMTAEIGLSHPPLGLNIYVVASAADASPEEVISGIWWPLGALLLCLLVLLLVPQISLFLPEHMLHIRNG